MTFFSFQALAISFVFLILACFFRKWLIFKHAMRLISHILLDFFLLWFYWRGEVEKFVGHLNKLVHRIQPQPVTTCNQNKNANNKNIAISCFYGQIHGVVTHNKNVFNRNVMACWEIINIALISSHTKSRSAQYTSSIQKPLPESQIKRNKVDLDKKKKIGFISDHMILVSHRVTKWINNMWWLWILLNFFPFYLSYIWYIETKRRWNNHMVEMTNHVMWLYSAIVQFNKHSYFWTDANPNLELHYANLLRFMYFVSPITYHIAYNHGRITAIKPIEIGIKRYETSLWLLAKKNARSCFVGAVILSYMNG